MSEENLEKLPVDRPERISDGFDGDYDYLDFDGDYDYLDFIFWAGLILSIAILIWDGFYR